MILAVSRFQAQVGLEEAVGQAFRDRPRLVDHVPGFLGMEVFTDAADAAVFCFVTRWSDLASFDAWHTSEAHRLSHKYMPKGLKLVPGFTEVNRLASFLEPPSVNSLRRDSAPAPPGRRSKRIAISPPKVDPQNGTKWQLLEPVPLSVMIFRFYADAFPIGVFSAV